MGTPPPKRWQAKASAPPQPATEGRLHAVTMRVITHMKRSLMVFAAALAALTQGSCKHTPPPNVAADVNGYAITYTELDKVFQQTQQPGDQSNEDQVAGAKLELLNTMITSR